MQECGGFYLVCATNECAIQVAEAAKTCIGNQKQLAEFWKDYMQISENVVEVPEDISIGWEEFDGLFEKICLYAEEKVPGAIVSGEANYCNVTGGFSACVRASRTDNGRLVIDDTPDDSDCEEGYHTCLACGDEFPEDECVYVEDCEGWFCKDCYENSF